MREGDKITREEAEKLGFELVTFGPHYDGWELQGEGISFCVDFSHWKETAQIYTIKWD